MIATTPNPALLAEFARPVADPIRVAVICDFVEENWPSMELVGNMLHGSLADPGTGVRSTQIRPRMPLALGSEPAKLSRVLGRFVSYPHELRRIRHSFDIFHITDHSYAHLVHALPGERTVVTCHDIDAFRCLINPDARRSRLFRGLSRRILTGMQHAAHVTCDTEATRRELVEHNLIPADKLTVVHNGVHPSFHPNPDSQADSELSRLIGRGANQCAELIHVGSTIPRKRIDVLLHVFAGLRRHCPDLRLLRVGGAFTAPQRKLAQSLGVLDHIDILPRLTESTLAAAYRRAAVLLQTSDSEGFGLPVIEAMACGTAVVASDIASLREVGGDAATYCPVGATRQFTAAVLKLLQQPETDPVGWHTRRNNLLAQARRFTWNAYAANMTRIYSRMLAQ